MMISRTYIAASWLALLTSGTVFGQAFPPGYLDPEPVLQAAVAAIGTDKLRCVSVSGSGYGGMVGQQHLHDKNVDWPLGELNNYTRTMNWDDATMREAFDRPPGLNPASWKYGLGWVGGTPLQQHVRQAFMVNGAYGWYLGRPGIGTCSRAATGRRALAARSVDQPAWFSEGCEAARCQSCRGLALGAGGDGA